MNDTEPELLSQDTGSAASVPPVRIRLWPAVAIAVLQAAVILVPELLAPGSFQHFMCMAWGPIVGAVALLAWWVFTSRAPWRDRLLGLGLFIVAVVACGWAVHKTMRLGIVFYALPTATTGLVATALATRRAPWPRRRWMLAASLCLLLAVWTAVRVDGMDGSLNADFAWRWSPTAEDQFLALADRFPRDDGPDEVRLPDMPPEPQAGDWPGFRGPRRDSRADGVVITTDWTARPPRELWRRRVGPGWSSFTVVGDYLFTQQQQGEDEVVVCCQTADGQPRWVNRHSARFSEVVSGAGPRATPTFHEGRLYTMGAHGAVQCLDATTGQQIWLREVTEDASAKTPTWGFASSPLILGEMVVVFAGGTDDKSVVCYDRQTGDVVWIAGEGRISYSSPQRAQVAGTDMILMATEKGLQALDPIDGRTIWHHEWPTGGMRIVQPQLIGDDQVLFGSGYGDGSRLLTIAFDGDGWDATEVWTTKALKPYFNDFVTHQGSVYGFDGKILTCLDLKDGRRRWKGGRYGYGQLLLLPAADVLLVLSETGEVVLVKAAPEAHVELCKFQAIEGKTWNHPVVVHGRLFVRNGQEAACFTLE